LIIRTPSLAKHYFLILQTPRSAPDFPRRVEFAPPDLPVTSVCVAKQQIHVNARTRPGDGQPVLKDMDDQELEALEEH